MLKGIVVGLFFLATLMGDANGKANNLVIYNSFLGDTVLRYGGSVVHRHTRRSYVSRHHSSHSKRVYRKESTRVSTEGLVTVPTAAHISITVARHLAPQFQGFVDDLVKIGYTPKHIGCWASGGHVANSNHYHGGACDFDQTGWNRTSHAMYHIGDLATKWGLRDGCSFHRPDCGHVDDGTNIGWKHPNNLIAKYIDFQTSPVPTTKTSQRQQHPETIDNFEGGM